jgi:murein DD-endopeptidase MepM/ murein hydrolase activator NlpD
VTGLTTRRPLLASLLLAVALFGLPATASAQTQGDVDQAERDLRRAEAIKTDAYKTWDTATQKLNIATAEFQEIKERREELTLKIWKLEDRIVLYQADADVADERAKAMIIDAYVNGGSTGVETVFNVESIQEIILSQIVLDEATTLGLSDLDQLEAVNREIDRLRLNLSDQEEDDLVLEADAAALMAAVQSLYAEADAAYDAASDEVRSAIDSVRAERREYDIAEAKRKAEAAAAAYSAANGAAAGLPPGAIPGFVCPVKGGSTFINSWGYPRSGGTRTHKGTDMYGSQGYGHPLVAVQDGYIKMKTVNLGGIVVYLYDDAGYRYYYAHLQGYPSGQQDGQRVNKGQTIGYMGATGNAGGPHLHFGLYPNGGSAVNPYPTVRAAC